MEDYLRAQLITYLGNKRKLLGPIANTVKKVQDRLGGRPLRTLDAFSGSGVVSRLLKPYSSKLITNDLEDYAAAVARSHLANKSEVDLGHLAAVVEDLNTAADLISMTPGFIQQMYAPLDDGSVQVGERAFYSKDNARRIDDHRRRLGGLPTEVESLLLGPLLSSASVHTNTSGVFRSFYKDGVVGKFGGRNGDNLDRILGTINLAVPLLSDHECEVNVIRGDAANLPALTEDMDLAYLDPPYNQHPYGSNYFMLNLITRYERPAQVSRVAGCPADWRRSGFNVKGKLEGLLGALVSGLPASHVVVSFNDQGFLSPERMVALLKQHGQVEVVEIPYRTFGARRGGHEGTTSPKEFLFLLER